MIKALLLLFFLSFAQSKRPAPLEEYKRLCMSEDRKRLEALLKNFMDKQPKGASMTSILDPPSFSKVTEPFLIYRAIFCVEMKDIVANFDAADAKSSAAFKRKSDEFLSLYRERVAKARDYGYKKLFLNKYQMKILEKSTKNAIKAAQESRMTLDKPALGNAIQSHHKRLRAMLQQLKESDQITDEFLSGPTFPSAAAAQKEYLMMYDAEVKMLTMELANLKNLQEQAKLDDHVRALNDIEKIILERIKEAEATFIDRKRFIELFPKLFLAKQYTSEDPYGHYQLMTHSVARGAGVVVSVFDSFDKVIPDILEDYCVNVDAFKKFKTGSKPAEHGINVASVIVDPFRGLAKESKFQALDISSFRADSKPTLKPSQFSVQSSPVVTEADVENIYKALESGSSFAYRMGGDKFLVDVSKVPDAVGKIVNLSVNLRDGYTFKRDAKISVDKDDLMESAAPVVNLLRKGHLLVFALGNQAVSVSSTEANSIMRSVTKLAPFKSRLLVAVALKHDGTTLADFSCQPGAEMAEYAVCAPGEDVMVRRPDGDDDAVSGTSFSAPYISAVAAIVSSNFSDLPIELVSKAILESATPIVMRPSGKRLFNVPVVLLDVLSKDLVPGKYQYLKPDGIRKDILVTAEMIKNGRAKYGMGRVHIFNALKVASKLMSQMLLEEGEEVKKFRESVQKLSKEYQKQYALIDAAKEEGARKIQTMKTDELKYWQSVDRKTARFSAKLEAHRKTVESLKK